MGSALTIYPRALDKIKKSVRKYAQEAITLHAMAMEAVGESDAAVQGHGGGEVSPNRPYRQFR